MESDFRGDEAVRSLSKPESLEVSGAENSKGVLSGCLVAKRRNMLNKSLQKECKSPS